MRHAPLVLLTSLAPALLGAQERRLVLEPHADWVHPGRFYEGPILIGQSNTPFTDGSVRLASFVGWGARLSLRPAGSRWALELDATTGTTSADAKGRYDLALSSGWFELRDQPARLSLFSLGVSRAVRASRAGTVVARLAGTLASTTMQERILRPPTPSSPGPGIDPFQLYKPWARRYVSPGGEAGLAMSLPVRGRVAVVASGTVALVRNETGDMGSNQISVLGNFLQRREAHWMPVSRLTLGVGLTR